MNNLGFVKNDADEESVKNNTSSLIDAAEARAVAEVQSAYVIANKFPRKELERAAAIIEICKRPGLANQALYAYPRGGTLVEGPSIRLAEAMAQVWGHIDTGIVEISRNNGVSVVEAYAIDLQNNIRDRKLFHVGHIRNTKKGTTKLTDERDIYELIANHGARRKRACILAIIPGDVIETAVNQCKQTIIDGNHEPLSERIKKLIVSFSEFGVKAEHLEKRLGHKLESIIPQELVTLGAIYKSLRDGMSDRSEFFDLGLQNEKTQENIQELIKNKRVEQK